MRRDQFDERLRLLNIERQELERKWKLQLEEQMLMEETMTFKQQQQQFSPMSSGAGAFAGNVPGFGQGELFRWVNIETGKHDFAFFDYQNTELKLLETDYHSNDWSVTILGVHEKGWVLIFNDLNDSNIREIRIYSINGLLLESVDIYSPDFNYGSSASYSYVWFSDAPFSSPSSGAIWVFDGEKLYTDTSLVGSMPDSWSHFGGCSNGVIFVSAQLDGTDTVSKFFLINGEGSKVFHEETVEEANELGNYFISQSSSFIVIKINPDGSPNFPIYKILDTTTSTVSQTIGDLATELTQNDASFFGTNSWFVCLVDSSGDRRIYVFKNGSLTVSSPYNTSLYNAVDFKYDNSTLTSFNDFDQFQTLSALFYSTDGSISFWTQSNNLVIANLLPSSGSFNEVVITSGDLSGPTGSIAFIPSISMINDKGLVFMGYPVGSTAVNIYSVGATVITNDTTMDSSYMSSEYDAIQSGDEFFFRIQRGGGKDPFERKYLRVSDDGSILSTYTSSTDNLDRFVGGSVIVISEDDKDVWTYSAASGWLESSPKKVGYDDPDFFGSEDHRSPNSVASYFNPPYLYWFNDVGGDFIEDGGDDMYDDGNTLQTNISPEVTYTHTQMSSPPTNSYNQASLSFFLMDGVVADGASHFGSGSSYFTNLYPGLFVMVAKNISIDTFETDGDLGSDSNTKVISGYIAGPTGYDIYYKSSNDNPLFNDPSVNHIMIVKGGDSGSITHDVGPESGNDTDFDQLTGLSGATEIHYLLFGISNGTYPTEEERESLVENYINLVDGKDINQTLEALNTSWESVIAALPPHDTNSTITMFNEGGAQTNSAPRPDTYDFSKKLAIAYYDNDRNGLVTIKLYDDDANLLRTVETDSVFIDDVQVLKDRAFVKSYNKVFDEVFFVEMQIYMITAEGHQKLTVNLNNTYDISRSVNDAVWFDD